MADPDRKDWTFTSIAPSETESFWRRVKDEVRPQRRECPQWIGWLMAFVLVGAVAGTTALLLSDPSSGVSSESTPSPPGSPPVSPPPFPPLEGCQGMTIFQPDAFECKNGDLAWVNTLCNHIGPQDCTDNLPGGACDFTDPFWPVSYTHLTLPTTPYV